MRKTMPRAALALAFVVLAVVAAPVAAGAARPTFAPEQPNPAFAQAMRERATTWSDRLPNPVQMHVSAATEARLARQDDLQPTYDLRSLGRLTAVRDQGIWGTCWAFANMAALESHLLVVNAADRHNFSEDNLITRSGFGPFSWTLDQEPPILPRNRLYKAGGWDAMAVAYFVRWAGPVNESDDPYRTPTPPRVNHVREHVQDVIMLPGRSGPLDNDLIKQMVENVRRHQRGHVLQLGLRLLVGVSPARPHTTAM